MPMERVRPGSERVPNVISRERADRPVNATVEGSFRDRLTKAQVGQLSDRIEKALAEVDQLAARLGETLNLTDLRRYRQAISALFKDLTSNMFQVKSEMEWDSQAWEHRTLVTVRKVDAELEQLTDLVLNHEQDRLAILAKIGEIKGMLLDVRM